MGKEWSGEQLGLARLGHGLVQAEAAQIWGVSEAEWRCWEDDGPPADRAKELTSWILDGLA